MDGTHGQGPDTSLLVGTGELPADFELNHILSVAAAYLDAGQVHDAEDLLQEALEADPDHPEVQALVRKIAHVRGGPPSLAEQTDELVLETPDVLVHFTTPLPGVNDLPPGSQRLVKSTEQYIEDGKIQSGLDLTLILCSEEPDYRPGFIRMAELQIATGNIEQARNLYESLSRLYDLEDEPAPLTVRSLGVALEPENVDRLIAHARDLLEGDDDAVLTPFVPEAIARGRAIAPEATLGLAQAWFERFPEDPEAQRRYIDSAAAIGEQQFVQVARHVVQAGSPLDLQVLLLAAEIVADSDQWIDALERVVTALRSEPSSLEAVQQLFTSSPVPADHPRAVISRSLMHQAAGETRRASDLLAMVDDYEPSAPIETFVLSYARALSLESSGDSSAPAAMIKAAQVAYLPEVEEFARTTKLFGHSANPGEILQHLSVASNVELSVEALELLKTTYPDRLDVSVALGEAYVRAGMVFEGLRELRFAAEAYEKAGNLAEMVRTMKLISKAVPTNIQIKAKLIDGYLRRGILDEAINEMQAIAHLYHTRGKQDDAVTTYTRAAEIASTIGNIERGNQLFEMAINVDPESVGVRHAAVAFYLQTGSIDRATDQLREVVRIALDQDDRDEAVAALHQIIALAPQDPGAYHRLGEVLTSLGEYRQAERVYRRLATIVPFDPVLEAKQSALAVLASSP